MLVLAIGLGALGLFALRRAHRCHAFAHGGWHGHRGWHGHHGWRGHGWHGHHGWHGEPGGPGGRAWMIDRALERLGATPAQERAIVAELDGLETRLRQAGRSLRDLRAPLADALRGPTLDEDALGSVLHGYDQATADARSAVVDALCKIHGLLDDGQRQRLAELLARGRAGAGPYRT